MENNTLTAIIVSITGILNIIAIILLAYLLVLAGKALKKYLNSKDK